MNYTMLRDFQEVFYPTEESPYQEWAHIESLPTTSYLNEEHVEWWESMLSCSEDE